MTHHITIHLELLYDEFLNLELSPWQIATDTTLLADIPPIEAYEYYYYDIGRQAQQLLRKYIGTQGYEIPPKFPDYFTRYFPVADGYIRIEQENEFVF